MKLTVGEFFEEYNTVVSESKLDPLKEEQLETLEMVSRILASYITEYCIPDVIPDNELDHEELLKQLEIDKETISKMCIALNNEIKYDDALKYFKILIKNQEELMIFLDIIDIYEESLLDEDGLDEDGFEGDGLEDAIDYVRARDLINIIPKESYLYCIIEGLYKGIDIEDIMFSKLKSMGIELKNNPVIDKPDEIKEFLNEVETFLFGLFIKGQEATTNSTLNSLQ